MTPPVRPELESITLSSALAATTDAAHTATSAADAAPDADALRQSLHEALTHLEQAVAILKTALDED